MTTNNRDLAVTDDDRIDAGLSDYLRAQNIVEAINANLPPNKQLPPIPVGYVFRATNREAVSTALHSAFELVGGLPKLVLWASQNPKDFYALWAKLLPTDTQTPVGGTTINFVSAIPQNPLDLVTVDSAGKVITLDADLPE